MSYFRFYIQKPKAIRKVLFLLIFLKDLTKVLFLVLNKTSIIKNCLSASPYKN